MFALTFVTQLVILKSFAFKVVFGVEGIDRSNYNEYIPGENRGDVIWDTNFDFSSDGCQKVISLISKNKIDIVKFL